MVRLYKSFEYDSCSVRLWMLVVLTHKIPSGLKTSHITDHLGDENASANSRV